MQPKVDVKMKKKKILFGYWFYNIGALILQIFFIAFDLFTIIQIIKVPIEVNPTMETLYYAEPFILISGIIQIYWLGYNVFRITIFSEEGIEVRGMWCTIRKLKWEEVKEVRNERFYVSVEGGFTSGWYLFDDGVERPRHHSGLCNKKTHITIPANKKNKQIIEEYYQGEIVEKCIYQ